LRVGFVAAIMKDGFTDISYIDADSSFERPLTPARASTTQMIAALLDRKTAIPLFLLLKIFAV